ncbi:hypothetical protein HDU96_008713 [Phlyctochytrium bullatum]|nr:hypothetical protein HDU96_008713 [Phlyctochytrium bullatum]
MDSGDCAGLDVDAGEVDMDFMDFLLGPFTPGLALFDAGGHAGSATAWEMPLTHQNVALFSGNNMQHVHAEALSFTPGDFTPGSLDVSIDTTSQNINFVSVPESASQETVTATSIPAATGARKRHKRIRGFKSCDFCIRRKLKCIVSPGSEACARCLQRRQPCLFTMRSAASVKEVVSGEVIGPSDQPEGSTSIGHGLDTDNRVAVAPSVEDRLGVRTVDSYGNVDASYPQQFVQSVGDTIEEAVPAAEYAAVPSFFDGRNMPPLPSLPIQSHLLRLSFQEPLSLAPLLHRASLPANLTSNFLLHALQALAARFNPCFESHGKSLFRHAKDVVLPGLCGELEKPSCKMRLELLQAAVLLIAYCLMDPERGGAWEAGSAKWPVMRWLALTVTCARQMALNKELEQFHGLTLTAIEKETRRRVWWMLYLIDSIHSIALNTPCLITDLESRHLRIMVDNFTWHRNLPINDDGSPFWHEVLSSLTAFHPDTTDTQIPAALRPPWSRNLSMAYLRRRANELSLSLWKAGKVPALDATEILDFERSIEAWCRWCFATPQDAEDDGGQVPASDYEEEEETSSPCDKLDTGFLQTFHRTAFLLVHSPRTAIQLCLRACADSTDPTSASRSDHIQRSMSTIRVWAATPHASRCRRHLLHLAAFWTRVLEGTVAPEKLLMTFYDRQGYFFGMLGWDAVYAAAVECVLETAGVEHEPEGVTARGGRKEPGFELFRHALVAMVQLWPGISGMLRNLLAFRDALRNGRWCELAH